MTMILKTTNNMTTIDEPKAARFVLAPSGVKGDTSACIHLLRLQDALGSVGLNGEARIDALAHVCTVWSGPRDIALDLCSRLAFALAHPVPFVFDVAELEAMCIKTRDRLKRDLDEDLRTGRDAPSTEDPEEDATLTPAERLRVNADESRALTTSLRKAVEAVAADLARYVALQPMLDHAQALREVIGFTGEGYDTVAQELEDLAADLDTPREQLLTNLSHAVEVLAPAETARERALATVQALHSEGRISDEAAAALNQSLETPDTVEGT